MPKVSVILPVYNCDQYIFETIQSVLNQTFADFELLIVDDCSTDKTVAIIKQFDDDRIQLILKEKNTGYTDSLNYAVSIAKGQYIARMDGDDICVSTRFEKQVAFLEANPDYVLCFHKVKILKPNGELAEDFITKVPENYEAQETFARLGNYIHTPSVVYRNILRKFPEEFEMSPIGDYFLYMMLAEHGKLKYMDEEMAVYRFGVGIHSVNSQIKMAKANFKLFALLLSNSNNYGLNKILIDRQLNVFDNFEHLIRNEYSESFVSNHVFFKAIKSFKSQGKFWRKLKNKFR